MVSGYFSYFIYFIEFYLFYLFTVLENDVAAIEEIASSIGKYNFLHLLLFLLTLDFYYQGDVSLITQPWSRLIGLMNAPLNLVSYETHRPFSGPLPP